jgi:microcystin degradation protein MlrC
VKTSQLRKLRVAIGGIWHETNTFAGGTTELDNFDCVEGTALLDTFTGTRTPLSGFIDFCRKDATTQLIPTFYASAVPSGMVSRSAYETLANRLVTAMKKASPDIILLDLHGAMVVDPYRDIESEFLVRLRGRFGSIPIGAVLDFHANISEEFAFLVDIMAGYDTYPHTDLYDRGLEVAERTVQVAHGKIVPTRAVVQPPLLVPPQAQLTTHEPMATLMARAHEWKKSKMS